MTKEETVLLRMSRDDKAAIKAAAQSVGKTLTMFITEAAVKKATSVARRPPDRVSTFFKASCFAASQGGTDGYATPGYHLAVGLADGRPDDIEAEKWERQIDTLKQLIGDGQHDEAWAWFQKHLPNFMTWVPLRRRDQFIAGVRRAFDEDVIGI